MKIDVRTYELRLEVPFAIARGTTSSHTICVAEVEHEGVKGLGEASPSAYYGDSLEAARAAIEGARSIIGNDPFAVRAVAERLKEAFPTSPSGRAAVEVALYDIMGKLSGVPLYRLFGLSGAPLPVTSFTVGVEDASLARSRIEILRAFPILKVKVGFGREQDLLALLAEETGATLRVDANEGWQVDEAIEKINAWERYSIEFFEQPIPKENKDGYREIKRATNATIFVDEGVSSKHDILQWEGLVDGVNIKLMKCGGLREAIDMIAVARACGLRVMLGCMVESALGITAAAHIASLVDCCDLDGNLLISNDPFEGVRAEGGIICLPDLPGLGVAARNA